MFNPLRAWGEAELARTPQFSPGVIVLEALQASESSKGCSDT